MPIFYSPEGVGLKPYKLPEDVLLDIGRLVAGCAELEDIIDLYFCNITGISEAKSLILFGRTSASAKVRLAETIAKARGGSDWETHKDCFLHPGYLDIVKCRNTVAHGWPLGITDEGRIAFQVKEVVGADDVQVRVTVLAYEPESIKNLADGVWATLPKLEETLKLTSLREKRRTQSLSPYEGSIPSAERRKTSAPASTI